MTERTSVTQAARTRTRADLSIYGLSTDGVSFGFLHTVMERPETVRLAAELSFDGSSAGEERQLDGEIDMWRVGNA